MFRETSVPVKSSPNPKLLATFFREPGSNLGNVTRQKAISCNAVVHLAIAADPFQHEKKK